MQDRKGFSELIKNGYGVQLPLPLPPVPRLKAHSCQYCHGIHMNVVDFIACRESNT